MTGTTVEIKKTPEIKTPEQLIERLKAKSHKNLADKVSTIEQTVMDGTESKWKKLQSELSGAEKQQIETILKDENPEVGTRLKTVAETAAGVAGVATLIDQLDGSMEKTGLGKLGIKDSIKEWITEALSEKPNPEDGFFDKLMHKLQLMFLSPLAKMFGVDPKKKDLPVISSDENLGKKLEDGKKKTVEIGGGFAFDKAAQGIVGLYPEKERNKFDKTTQGLAASVIVTLQGRSLKEIEDIYNKNKNDPKKLVLAFGLTDTSPEALRLAILSLIHNKETLASYFAKDQKNTDWENRPIEDLLKMAGSELAMIVNVGAIETYDDAKKWLEHLVHPNPKGDSGESEETFKMKLETVKARYKGLDFKVVSALEGVNPSEITNDYLQSLQSSGKLTEDGKGFILKTLVPFREKFLVMLDNPSINLGMDTSKMKAIFSGEKGVLGMGEILNIFIRTGGHMNYEDMNGFEHVMLYQMILGYLIKKDPDKSAGPEYITLMIKTGLSGETKFPPQVQKIFGVLGNASEHVVIGTLETIWGGFKGVFEGLSPSGKAAVITAGGMFVYLLRVLFIGKVAVLTMAATAIISGIFASAAASATNPETKKELESKAKEIQK